MKKITVFALLFFVAVIWCQPLRAAELKKSPPIPKEVTVILTEVNQMLKTEKTRENLGFIERSPRQEISPMGILHIVGQTKNGMTFVIDVYIVWISPEDNLYIIPDLVAGETVPAIWWWKNGERNSWTNLGSEGENLPPPPEKPKGISI